MSIKIFDVPDSINEQEFNEFMGNQIEAFRRMQEKEKAKQEQQKGFEKAVTSMGLDANMADKISREIEYIDKISPTYTGVLLDVLQNEKKQLQGLTSKSEFTPSEVSKLKEINFKYK